MAKKRNAQDATLRNINALKKRVAALQKAQKADRALIKTLVRLLDRTVQQLEATIWRVRVCEARLK